MSVSNEKVRTNITFPKDLKLKLEKISKTENRSFNNLVITILKRYIEEN